MSMTNSKSKLALCIGINNYPGTNNDLSGCVNDARDWAAELEQRRFAVECLFDKAATKDAIVTKMSALLAKANAGDVVAFTYSGHGTWVPDTSGDEPDRRDEALCPYDVASNLLIDDELYDIFLERKPGVRVVFLSDSCHSGTVAKFGPVVGSADRKVKFLPLASFEKNASTLAEARRVERAAARGRARTGALLLAGCQDFEYSYDANFGGKPNGAFTRVALDTLVAAKPTNYREWYQAIREKLPSMDYPQTPQLVATRSQKLWPIFE